MRGYIRRGGRNRKSRNTWELTVDLGVDPLTGKRDRQFITYRGTRKEAEAELNTRVMSLQDGTWVAPSKETVVEYLVTWIERQRHRLAPRGLERYDEITRLHLIPALGAIRLADLRPSHIDSAMSEWLGKKLRAATVLKIHQVLHKAIRDAVRLRKIAVNPVDAVEPPRPERREMSVLNAEQASALIEGVRDAEFGVAIPVALYSGLRLSELRGLRWKDADLSTGNLRVVQTVQRLRDGSLVAREPKTDGSRRAVSIPILIRELLRDHRTAQIETRLRSGIPWSEESLVFGDALGNPISETRFRKALKNVLTQAKLPTIRLHDLRHTMATLMLAAGEHPKVVAERLGHSTVNLTLDTYSHVLPGLQEAAAERLASSLAKAKADAKATTDS